MKSERIGVRVSADFRAMIERHGDLSAASQALMLIGAAALNAPLASVAADLLWLEQQDVSAAVKAQLRFLFNQMFNNTSNDTSNTAPHLPYAAPKEEAPPIEQPAEPPDEPAERDEIDPFMAAGIEV